ncbi:MAG TPA: TetR/AcrR family transcriptional regulator [Desulfobacteraceae bacterium]|nr:TetR/AcrR family transcriptional regulator [Desulfobacteraceae bacterium]
MRPANPKNKVQILEMAIPLFAKSGFNGVSMRDIAAVVGISAAALYYHFSDKQSLYLQAVAQAFANKDEILTKTLATDDPPEQRLYNFIFKFSELIYQDANFLSLLIREMLDGDDERLQKLTNQVFRMQFSSIIDLCKELAPKFDSHLLAVSIIGQLVYHIETKQVRVYLKGGKPEHNDPEAIANHIFNLVMYGAKSN